MDDYIHHVSLPSYSDVLVYFKFEKDFNYLPTYYNNYLYSSSSSNVLSEYSNEGEFVCYCTGSYPNFLKVSPDFYLNAFDLTSSKK